MFYVKNDWSVEVINSHVLKQQSSYDMEISDLIWSLESHNLE